MLIVNTPKSPSATLIKDETEHLLMCFCTFCSLLKGKKLSLQNVFILVLQEKRLRAILKELLTIETNFDVLCHIRYMAQMITLTCPFLIQEER